MRPDPGDYCHRLKITTAKEDCVVFMTPAAAKHHEQAARAVFGAFFEKIEKNRKTPQKLPGPLIRGVLRLQES